MPWENPSPEQIRSLLQSARTIAVVGCSPNPLRTSHQIAAFLKRAGYRMIPVHPSGGTILGEQAYTDLEQIPDDMTIDIVDVFRRSEAVGPVAQAAVRKKARALWLQLGVVNERAYEVARSAGLTVIMDECISVQHRLLLR